MRERSYLVLILLMTAGILCCLYGMSETSEAVTKAQGPGADFYYEITEADTSTGADIETEDMTEISLEEEAARCQIDRGGTYLLTGNYEGQIWIDAKEYPVHLILDNVSVESNLGPALHVASASKVILTAKEGTDNTFRDVGDYGREEADGCIFSVSDLTINGSGSLSVYGYGDSAISSKDHIKILGGNISLQSKKDGIRANDGMVIRPETLVVESEGSGIVTRKAGKDEKGFIHVCGGEISIVSGKYGIYSANALSIRDCSLTVKSVVSDYACEGKLSVGRGYITNE